MALKAAPTLVLATATGSLACIRSQEGDAPMIKLLSVHTDGAHYDLESVRADRGAQLREVNGRPELKVLIRYTTQANPNTVRTVCRKAK